MAEVFALFAAAAGLAVEAVKLARDIDTFIDNCADAPLTFRDISTQCSSIAFVLAQIQQLALRNPESVERQFGDSSSQMTEFLERTLENLVMILSVLERKLKGVTERSTLAIVWKKEGWNKYLDMMKQHFANVNLVLSILQTNTLEEIRGLLLQNEANAKAVAEDTEVLYIEDGDSLEAVYPPSESDTHSTTRPPTILERPFEPELFRSIVYAKAKAARQSRPANGDAASSMNVAPDSQLRDEIAQRQESLAQTWAGALNLTQQSIVGIVSKPRLEIQADYVLGTQRAIDEESLAVNEANLQLKRSFLEAERTRKEKIEALARKRDRDLEILSRAWGQNLAQSINKGETDDDFTRARQNELQLIMACLETYQKTNK